MTKSNVWDFLGVKRNVDNEAEKVLQKLIEMFLLNVESFSGISYQKFETAEAMIEEALQQRNNPYGYFWDWFNKHGLLKLRKIGSIKLNDTDEDLDFLDYRLYVLEEDSRNEVQSLIASLADAIGEIHKYCLSKASNTYEYLMQQVSKWSFEKSPLVSASGICFINNLLYKGMLA